MAFYGCIASIDSGLISLYIGSNDAFQRRLDSFMIDRIMQARVGREPAYARLLPSYRGRIPAHNRDSYAANAENGNFR